MVIAPVKLTWCAAMAVRLPSLLNAITPMRSYCTSFIQKARNHGAESLLGPLPTYGRFDTCLDGLEIVSIDSSTGIAVARMTIQEKHANAFETLHGGAVCTLVDVLGTLALLAKDVSRPGVSGTLFHTASCRKR